MSHKLHSKTTPTLLQIGSHHPLPGGRFKRFKHWGLAGKFHRLSTVLQPLRSLVHHPLITLTEQYSDTRLSSYRVAAACACITCKPAYNSLSSKNDG